MDAGPTHTSDAIDLLLAEHRTILAVVDGVEREVRGLETGGPLREPFWRDVLRFCDEFDFGLHHAKEERLLFPAIEQALASRATGPTAVLRDEHARLQVWRQRLEQALVARDRARLAASATLWSEAVRDHVRKEDLILFPLARRLLAPAGLEQLRHAFAGLAADLDPAHWLPAR